MGCLSLRALAAQALLSLTYLASAQSDTTTTITVQSTSTVLTSTTTVTLGGSTYASATTATANIVSGSTIIQGAPVEATPMSVSGSGSYAGTAFQDAVLNSTNYFRTQHQANAVTWDSTLASFAQNYAEKCIFEHSVHSPPSSKDRSVQLTPDLTGRALRRESSRKLRNPDTRHRRLGRRREKIQLRDGALLRGGGPLHPAGLEGDDESRLWRDELQ